jgi:putative radical SAM enzyme (TIGR03279 family)
MAGLLIERVVPGSIAAEMEIEAGDRLVAINGHPLRDIIDYNFFAADPEIVLEIVKGDGEEWEVELERGDEPLGLLFPAPLPLQCGNRCVFCFVHQLPRGLRSPLYVKDEDYRLSFLYGNYVTLANIGREELDRIREQRLSPLYISVHATDPALRERLLGKEGIAPIREVLEELAAARITMHTQVVLCPGLNDGEALERTVADLAKLHPRVASLAVVPVGLTSHRRGLPRLAPVTGSYAASFIAAWEPRGRALEKKLGAPFLFLADEFYVKAGLAFPPLAAYGDLPQLENGVGMVPLFLSQAAEVLGQARPLRRLTATVVTGRSPFRYLAGFLKALTQKTGVVLRPVAVRNTLFGAGVTVTGLVAARDIIAQLKGKELGEVVLVPDVMLKEGEGVFLDDLSPGDVEEALGVPVIVVEATPQGIYGALRELTG